MAITLAQIQKIFSENWRLKNLYGQSRYAVLFPNELRQTGGAFKAEVELPIMLEGITQKDWDPRTGFSETYQVDETKTVQLTQNFTIYNRIANHDKLASNWASNKLNIIDSQKAKEIDDYVLKTIGTGVTNNIAKPVKITKDNFAIEIKRLERMAESKKFQLKDALIFMDSLTVGELIQGKIEFTRTSIENTSATILNVFGYNIVEADLEKYGHQMVAIHHYALAWIMATERPLQAGVYTQGAFLGQTFVANNEFYEAKVIMEEYRISYPKVEPVQETGAKNKDLNKSLNDLTAAVRENTEASSSFIALKAMIYDQLSEIVPPTEKQKEFNKDLNNFKNILNLDDLFKIKQKWTSNS